MSRQNENESIEKVWNEFKRQYWGGTLPPSITNSTAFNSPYPPEPHHRTVDYNILSDTMKREKKKESFTSSDFDEFDNKKKIVVAIFVFLLLLFILISSNKKIELDDFKQQKKSTKFLLKFVKNTFGEESLGDILEQYYCEEQMGYSKIRRITNVMLQVVLIVSNSIRIKISNMFSGKKQINDK